MTDEPQWEDVTKARSKAEADAEDAAMEFLISEGWVRHDEDDNLFMHPTKHPTWETLADALIFEKFGVTS